MKNQKAQLERKRPLLFAAGLLFALSVTLVSFEWRTPYTEPIIYASDGAGEEEPIWIPVTLPEPKKKLEMPELPKPEIKTDQIDITENAPDPKTDEVEVFVPEKIEDIPTSGTKEPEPEVEDPVLDWVPKMPEYCKGPEAMMKFLGKNLKYPKVPLDMGVSGVVVVQFVVGKDGQVRDVQIARSVDPWLDAEALRVVKMLDCFHPGAQGGRNVDVYMKLPVRFSLGG